METFTWQFIHFLHKLSNLGLLPRLLISNLHSLTVRLFDSPYFKNVNSLVIYFIIFNYVYAIRNCLNYDLNFSLNMRQYDNKCLIH